MKTRSCGITTLLLLITLIFSSSMASASINFDETDPNDPYHVGKITYFRKLACSSCPLSNTIIDTSLYKSIIQRLNNDKQLMAALNEEERLAVTYYLEKLFTPR